MSVPSAARLVALLRATWPAETETEAGRFVVPAGGGAGNRVSAARLAQPDHDGHMIDAADLAAMEAAQDALGQERLVMVLPGQEALDATLAARGYDLRDPVVFLSAPAAAVAAPPPPVTCFDIWPPLAVQDEIWAEAGIGPARRAVMDRVTMPKTSLFGRADNRPAASAFVAADRELAMVHALEVLPRARRKGLGGHLMRTAANWATEAGAEMISVFVTRENLPALGLYASLGLQAVGHYHYRVRNNERA